MGSFNLNPNTWGVVGITFVSLAAINMPENIGIAKLKKLKYM